MKCFNLARSQPLLLLSTLIVSAQALAQAQTPEQADTGEQTLVTIADAHHSPALYVDGGMPGDSLGDQYIFDQPLLDKTASKKIGTNSGFCLRTRMEHSLQCQWTLTLKDGSIQVAGREHDQGESDVAIVGGTGLYRHISGDMRSVKNKNGSFTQTLRFTLNE